MFLYLVFIVVHTASQIIFKLSGNSQNIETEPHGAMEVCEISSLGMLSSKQLLVILLLKMKLGYLSLFRLKSAVLYLDC